MKRLFLVTLLFVCFGICAGELHFEPLFHSSSVYFRSEKVRQCRIFYREKGSQEWLETFEPQFDSTAPAQYRTSIVNLKENTEYEVQVQIRVGTRNRINAKGTFRTWADRVPIAKTIVLTPEQVKNGYAIRNVKGKADGWIRYTTKPGTVVRAKKGVRQALLVDRCEYVIVENMVIRGGDTHGVVLDHCKYVRLRNLDISNWFNPEGWWFEKKTGRIRNARYKHLYSHNGIDIRFGYGQVIERCYIHDPALTSNEWRYGHPDGPQGIGPCKPRSTVIRYNDICGSDLKWWNDGIAGPYNFDADGGLNRDCDVYGNYIAFANDDGIELDGGQQNVRCYRNIFEHCFMGMSIQGCITGPSYLFENLCTDFGSEFMLISSGLKTADTWAGIHAASFIYNNTFDAPTRIGICSRFRMVVKNNILRTIQEPSQNFSFLQTQYAPNLLTGPAVKGNLSGTPRYVNGEKGLFALREDSPGKGKAVKIPGFYHREDSDMGIDPALELPARPYPLSLPEGRKVAFTVKKGVAAPAVQTVKVEASAPVSFTVRKSADSDWYTVTPSKVSLKAGESATLRVTLLPEKMNKRIHYRSAFFLRNNAGFSRPVNVMAVTDHRYPDPFALGKKGIFRYTFGAPYKKLPGGGVRMEERNKSKVRIDFDLDKDATVGIYVLARDSSNINYGAINLGIDKEVLSRCAVSASYWPRFTKEKFTWMRLGLYPMKKGKHFLIIQPRKVVDLKELCIIADDVSVTEFR